MAAVCNPFQVFAQVNGERKRQVEKWGEQHHANGTGPQFAPAAAQAKREYAAEKERTGDVSWRTILHEEVCEAFEEANIARLRQELVQVAAVAIAWIEDLDSQTGGGQGRS